MFAMQATYHITLQASPMQVVFGRDAVLNIQHQIDWTILKNRKQKLIKENNVRENKSRIPHQYQINDKKVVVFLELFM